MDDLVLTIDLGTQSLRAVLVDRKGAFLHTVKRTFQTPYHSPQPNWAEQEASFYWAALCAATKELADKAGEAMKRVQAMSLTCIRDSVVCLNDKMEPISPVILWLDDRESRFNGPTPAMHRAIFKIIGMDEVCRIVRKDSTCNWLRTEAPQIWEKTAHFVFLPTYLTFKLCNQLQDSRANMIGRVPFDNKKGRWMSPKDVNFCLFPVEKEKLCKLVDPGEILGYVSSEAARETGLPAGLPLIATGSDKSCETLGLSCTTPEKAAISLGTTATVQYTVDRYLEPQRFFPAYYAALPGHWNPEIQIYRGYWLISWFKKEFGAKEVAEAKALGVAAEDLLNRRLKEVPPGCEGLVMQPFFTPGVSMPNARGAMIGFSDVHTRIHLYRAIIEGINFALMEGMHQLERRMKSKTEGLYLAGGGSSSREIAQITADMFNLPVYRSQSPEAAVIGSSLLTFYATGAFASIAEAMESMVHLQEPFLPNERHHEVYQKLYEGVFLKIFDRLAPLYELTKEIQEG